VFEGATLSKLIIVLKRRASIKNKKFLVFAFCWFLQIVNQLPSCCHPSLGVSIYHITTTTQLWTAWTMSSGSHCNDLNF